MQNLRNQFIKYFTVASFILLQGVTVQSQAAVTGPISLAAEPLGTLPTTSSGSSVLPNVMFVLDTSGSMGRAHMPDNDSGGVTFGYYGARSSQCNQVYYDPNITYTPPIKADGTRYPDMSFTSAKTDGFQTGSGTVNLNSQFKAAVATNSDQLRVEDSTGQQAYYYAYSGAVPRTISTDYHDNSTTFSSECGNNTAAGITFNWNDVSGTGPATGVGGVFTKVNISTTSPATEQTNFANWYSYYRTRMLMMKTASGEAFSKLIGSNYRVGLQKLNDSTPSVRLDVFTRPSTHRTNWYSTLYGANASGGTPLRDSLSVTGNYYAGNLSGTDPVQYSCQQNFTILSTDGYWNGGDGFDLSGDDVGNQDGSVARPFYDGAVATSATTTTTSYTRTKYSRQRNQGGCSGTTRYRLKTQPEIQTCDVTGSVSNCSSWGNNGSATYSACTTRSGAATPTPNPTAAVAGTPITSTTTSTTGGTSDTLADIAMYYYTTDLRPGTCTLCTDNVFTSGKDNNIQQHMTTFTLGLGASGFMQYDPAYETAGSGDFFAVKNGQLSSGSVCTWQASGLACNWPAPSSNAFSTIDDLWHAAINGRGAYFSATDPSTLATGLSNALTQLDERRGAAAAAATSTLNPVAGNNSAFVASYTTVSWTGNLESRGINTDTGLVNENADWCVETVPADKCDAPSFLEDDAAGDTTAKVCVTPGSITCPNGTLDGTDCRVPVATSCTGTMVSKVSTASDTRNIWTTGPNATTLNNFKWLADGGDIDPAVDNPAVLSGLSQWSSYIVDATATPAIDQQADAKASIIDYLRGQKGKENSAGYPDNLFRDRSATLGDAIESQPAYIAAPTFNYVDTGYAAYKTAKANRAGAIYLGANDGMMHAFDATSGSELWAFVPRTVIPNMWKLADKTYATNHQYLVNGSPVISDIYDGSNWKTILVAGLNGGGRGYYALDITDPAAPVHLWDFTASDDADLGFTFGRPVVTKKSDGTWVVLVTSGYNNGSAGSPAGDGNGHLFVMNANTGAVISKITTTGSGSTASTPSGLAQISAYASDGEKNNAAIFVYGGDLLGNVWRFDINAVTVTKFAILKDANGGAVQPITTKLELGQVLAVDGLHRVVYVGTGQYLAQSDLADTQQQTIYAIKDDDTPGGAVTATLDAHATSALVQQTMTVSGNNRSAASPPQAVNFSTDRGWLVDLPVSGERISVAPQLVQGTLLVPTTIPSSTVCSPGGESWLNFFDYRNGGAVGTGGLVGVRASGLIVGMNVFYITDPITGKIVPKVNIVTGLDPTPELVKDPPFSTSGSGFQKKRAIWRELIQ